MTGAQDTDMRTTLGLGVVGAIELMRQMENDHMELDVSITRELGRVSELAKCHREAGRILLNLRRRAPNVVDTEASRPLSVRLLAPGHSSWHDANPPLDRLPPGKRKENLGRLLDALAACTEEPGLREWATRSARLVRAL